MGLFFDTLRRVFGLEDAAPVKMEEFKPVTLTEVVTGKSNTVESEVKAVELEDKMEVKVEEPKPAKVKKPRKPRAKKKV